MSTERMANGRSSDPDRAGEGDAPQAVTLDLDSQAPDEPSTPADSPWTRHMADAAGPAAAGTAALFGAVALVVAAYSAAQPACVFPEGFYEEDGWPRWAVVVACLAVAAGGLGVAGVWTGRRADTARQVAVSLAALLLAGATLAVTAGDVVTRPHFDREGSGPGTQADFDPLTGMPLIPCN